VLLPGYKITGARLKRHLKSVFGFQFDDGASRLGFVRREARESLVAPIRKIDDSRRLNSIPRSLVGRLQNVQSIAIEQKSVIPKQFIQLPNRWVAIGKGFGFELVDGSFDLCGSQFHRLFLSTGFFVLQRRDVAGHALHAPATFKVVERWSIFPARTHAGASSSSESSGEPAIKPGNQLIARAGSELCVGTRLRHTVRNTIGILIFLFDRFLSPRTLIDRYAFSTCQVG
jgi:hypothetical protein